MGNFQDIIQDLKDDFEIDWFITSSPNIKREGSDEIKKGPFGIQLTIINTENKPMNFQNALPYIEQLIDRFEEIGLYFECITIDDHMKRYNVIGKKFKSLDEVNIEAHHEIKLNFLEKEDPKPKSRIQKFKDYFNGNYK